MFVFAGAERHAGGDSCARSNEGGRAEDSDAVATRARTNADGTGRGATQMGLKNISNIFDTRAILVQHILYNR